MSSATLFTSAGLAFGTPTEAPIPANSAPAVTPAPGRQTFLAHLAVARRVYYALLERFDQDNSGRLTPAEQVQALDYLKQERPRIYHALVRRFSWSGGPDLDANERAAMFQFLASIPAAYARFEPVAKTTNKPPA